MVEGGVKVEDAGDMPDRLRGKISPEGWAAYKRITSMSDEEYMEMSHRESDEHMIKEMLERIP